MKINASSNSTWISILKLPKLFWFEFSHFMKRKLSTRKYLRLTEFYRLAPSVVQWISNSPIDTTHAPVGLSIRVWMDGRLLISCDWHFVIISFLPFLFRVVRFIYLDTFLSGLNLLKLLSKKGNKKGKKQNNHKGGKNRKKPPINTSYIWILGVCVFFTTISSYFGRTIPLSTFHQHYLSNPKVEASLLHFCKVNARFEWG